MTKDDVIRLAREAGIGWGEGIGGMPDFLEAFAKLIAEHERKEIIAITETQDFSRMYGEFTPSSYDLVKAIRARGQA